MRFHIHDFRFDGGGYLDWIPTMRPVGWITVYKCSKCKETRCVIREPLSKVKFRDLP